MLATWTGANAGASWITTRPPFARSMTSRSSAGIVFHALAGALATMSLGVGSFLAGAAPISERGGSDEQQIERMTVSSPSAASL